VEWNRGSEQLYGYSRDEALGKQASSLVRTSIRGSSLAAFKKRLIEEGGWSGELQHTTKDQRVLTVEAEVQLVTIGGQQIVLESTRDITDRKAWEARQQMLLGELTHRVKNTLAVVQSIAHQTLRTSKSTEKFAERFDGRLMALASAHKF